MKGGIPSEHNEYPDRPCRDRPASDGLRPWAEVSRMYTANTGEMMNPKLAENVHQRALKKLRIVLGSASNAEVLDLLRAELA